MFKFNFLQSEVVEMDTIAATVWLLYTVIKPPVLIIESNIVKLVVL